ncbi:MAG TPA: hypothetical protein VM784_05705 [Actinomycetota bacterium]|nr:hypothetical protein [Actinomycetota bacterium]
MKRLFGKPDDKPSKEELERQAADELAAAARPSQWGAPSSDEAPRPWATDDATSAGGGSPSSWGALGRAAAVPAYEPPPTEPPVADHGPSEASSPSPWAIPRPEDESRPPQTPGTPSGLPTAPAPGRGPGLAGSGMAPFFTPPAAAPAETFTPPEEEEAITEIALQDLAGRSGSPSSPEELTYIKSDAERAAAARDRALQEFLEAQAERNRRRSQNGPD